jgi:carboxyl-terminal processing protease
VIAGSGPSPELPKNKEAGIGAAVGREHDKDGNETQTGPLMINDVVPNSPAEKAGLAPGDKIKAVNGTDVTRLPIDDAIMLVRGRANTDVTLTIIRDGKERDITITRQVVTPVDVTDKDLGDGIAYIRLHDFGDEKTVEAMRDALTKHDDADALVLDLRNNPGGRLDVVIDMLSMFVRDGKLLRVYARMGSPAEAPMYSEAEYSVKGSKVIDSQRPGGTGDPKVKDMSRMTYMVDGRPLVVLVNGLSASASEVFAGAVKDNKAAILVGDTTYGKGVGQSYLHLSPEVTLSVTSLRYTSPSGHWAGDANEDKRGITPHVSVTNPEGTRLGGKEDLQLQKAIEILKEQKKTPRGRNAIAA